MSAVASASATWLGLVAGLVHVASGPDHLAGIAPFAATRERAAWRVGASWGLGHAAGAGAAALVALSLRTRVPGAEAALSAWSERIVGVFLCAVGAFGLSRALRARAGVRATSHATDTHAMSARARTPFVLGLFHGAAGLSHLFGVVPALALPGVALPALYLVGYATGSLACSSLFAAGLGRVARRAGAARAWRVLAFASVASVAVGVAWIVGPA